ncbi:MAG TPA: STM3941 family protein, partial [Burkholderiales bacterium]|nr:STM3941 family protein [Burkholderiales bacterium]
MAILLAGSLAFVAAGAWLVSEKPLIGYLCVILFGLCALVFAVQLHPDSSYLTLSSEGFTFCALFRRTFVPWSQAGEFVVVNVRNHKMVGWNYAPEYQG